MPIDLSISVIFKNENRCIERCLQSIQPLRKLISCEIVMADTGSTDGSREVAERYADIVFDFPWIDDFSAARNAVLERCSGAWVLTMDCDEWLDADMNELVAFVRDESACKYCGAGVLVRNYSTAEMDRYMDILLPRLMCMGAKPRYEGAIHEIPVFSSDHVRSAQLRKTMLHHDGYIMLNDGSEEGKIKRARNVALLRTELQDAPDNLQRLLQYLEAAEGAEDYLPTLRHAVALVMKQRGDWRRYGAAILRRAVFDAYNGKLPELDEWIGCTYQLFPQSYYTRIDVAFIRFVRAIVSENASEAISLGEGFLSACASFRDDSDAYIQTSVSFLQRNDAYWVQYVRLRLAEAYCESGETKSAGELLRRTDWGALDKRHTQYFLSLLAQLEKNGYNIRPLLQACRNGLSERKDARAEECRAVFRELTEVNEGPTAEMMQLAAKVKAILERFPPDDPAVIELKNSPAYQKVAWLIEGGKM